MSDVKLEKIEEADSSMISGLAQDGADLVVRFRRDGAVFRFKDAGYHLASMRAPGESIGKYFHANIRGQFDGEKLEGLES